MTFDRVLPELVRICEEHTATRVLIVRYCVVRDVRGRVRLVVDVANDPTGALDQLEADLIAALGAYFVPPVISALNGGELRRLAQQLLSQAERKWPSGWPQSVQNLLGGEAKQIEHGVRWTGIERTIGKEAWLASTAPKPPWPLVKGKTPPIVTFHSFKGGVGRTTLVAAHAIRQTATKPPKRVAVVDLDLEAPGLGSLLGVKTERGVLDVLVDHLATGRVDLDGASAPAQLVGSNGPVTVYPAGRIDAGYMQKLARLDFSSSEPGADNPVGVALQAMLNAIKATADLILLDSRAGLHDLAGISLHGLAHVDVLVFRGTDQNLTGLEQTLRTLGARSITKLVLVETLLPSNDEELLRARQKRTRSRVYELVCEHIYPENDPPQLGDVGEIHDIIPVRRKEWLDALDTIGERVSDVVNEGDLAAVSQRIDEECLFEIVGDDGQVEEEGDSL